MLSDRDIKNWDQRLQDQAGKGWDNYAVKRIDLTQARTNVPMRKPGEFLYVSDSSGASALATVRLNRTTNPPLNLKEGVEIKTIFTVLFISNEAQAGEWIDLTIGINFEYKKKIAESGATLLVAASNSLARSKSRADYVCDGVADEVQINAALTRLSSVGGMIQLLEGTFTIAALIAMYDNTALVGTGFGTLLNFDVVMNRGICNEDLVAGNSNIVLAKMKLDGFDKTEDPIELVKCDRSIIRDIEVTRGYHDGVELQACLDCIVTNVIAHDSNQYHGIELDECYQCIVENSIVYASPSSGILLDGVAHDNLITNCISRDNTGWGVGFHPDSYNNVVMGCLTPNNSGGTISGSGTNNISIQAHIGKVGINKINIPLCGLHLGSTAPVRGLTANDDAMVSGKFEVAGQAFFNNQTRHYNAIDWYGAGGANLSIYYKHELVTIAVGNSSAITVADLAPAGSIITAVTVRTNTAPGGGPSNFDIGRTGGGNLDEYIDNQLVAAGVKFNNAEHGDGSIVGPGYNAAADTLTVTATDGAGTPVNVTGTDMVVRIVLFFMGINEPTS